jgi:hypothetical protein
MEVAIMSCRAHGRAKRNRAGKLPAVRRQWLGGMDGGGDSAGNECSDA